MSKDFENFRAYALTNWDKASRDEATKNRDCLKLSGDAEIDIPAAASIMMGFTLLHLYHDWLASSENVEE